MSEERTPLSPRARIAISAGAAAVLFAAAFGLAAVNVGRSPERRPLVVEAQATPVFIPRADVRIRAVPIPTPVLAAYRGLQIHLPVKPQQVTVIAFHQAGSTMPTLHMRSLVEIVRSSQLAKPKPSAVPTGPDESAEIAAAEQRPVETVYAGKVLRLWRSGRSGDPDTAVDVGTSPGLPVYAPVTGEVAAVHRYNLYGQYADYEIHILPDGWDKIDVIVLHTTDPVVGKGDRVTAGVTRISTVRQLSKWFDSQLDDYTHDGGNHVHVQLEALPRPGAIHLMNGPSNDTVN